MNAHVPTAIDTTQLAISAAVAIAAAPFVELEHQSRMLAEMAACGFLAKQDAVDVAHTAALGAFGPRMVHRHGADTIQEIIAAGFELEPPKPQPVKPRPYRTPQSTVDAFWYVVRNESPARLKCWLAEHPDDSGYLERLWEAKCRPST